GPLVINDGLVPFMPNATGLLEIRGLEDQRVTRTADKLRAIRAKQHEEEEKAGKAALPAAKMARPFYELVVHEPPGDRQTVAVVYAEVRGLKADGTGGRVKVIPTSKLCGVVDPAYLGEIDAEIHFGDKSAIRERPHVGAKALVLLKGDEEGKYSIPDTPVDYFP